MKRLILSAIATIACLSVHLGAANYYVSNAGLDSNAGTSTTAPWATVAKVNATTLHAGDVVSFECGGIWREQLIMANNGSSGSRITFTSYGSGSKPLFLNSVNKSASSDWLNVGTNLWTAGGRLGTNVILNSSFDTDTSNWGLPLSPTGGGSATLTRSTSTPHTAPGCAAVAITASGTQDIAVVLQSNTFSTTSGKRYRLQFWAKASTAFTMSTPFLAKQSDFTKYYSGTVPSAWSGAITTSWQLFQVDYSINTSASDAAIAFRLGNISALNGATVYFDDISIQDYDISLRTDVGSINMNSPSYVSNPSFTVDTSGWVFYANTGGGASGTFSRDTITYNSAPAASAVAVTAKGTSAGDIQLMLNNVSITGGLTYELRFMAKASTSFTMFTPGLIKDVSPYTNYSSSTTGFSGAVTTAWTTYTVRFTANTNANDGRLEFFLGNSIPNGATLYLDDISFTQVTDNPSQIANPSFTTNLSGWTFFANPGVAAATNTRDTVNYNTAPASSSIAVTTPGSAASDIQFNTANLSVTSGKVYRLTFAAKATSTFTMALPGVLKSTSPYTQYTSGHSQFQGTINTFWSYYTIDYTANTTATDAEIVFFLGNSIPAGATLSLDDITFKEVFNNVGIDPSLQNSLMGFRKQLVASLAAQGDYWYDSTNFDVEMYSTANPATLYTNIECTLTRDAVTQTTANTAPSDLIFDGLSFWNGGRHGVALSGVTDVVIANCDMRFLGGGIGSTGFTQLGNAVQFWATNAQCTVLNNYISNIWDSGVTNQYNSSTVTVTQSDINYTGNTLVACQYSFELWLRPAGSSMANISFTNNTCRDAGESFSYAQRPDPGRASHILLASSSASATNVVITNNLCDSSSVDIVYRDGAPGFTDIANVTLDYNTYIQVAGDFADWNATTYTISNFASYQSTSTKDAHSTLN